MEPATFTLANNNAKAAYVDPGSHTYSRDGVTSKLDWFLVCPELAISAEAMVNTGTHISGHSPVRLNVGGKLCEDMGSRINRSVDFQGITRKEARTSSPTEGTFIMKGNCLNQKWKHWNESAEEYLAQKEGTTGDKYYGRGTPIQYVKKHHIGTSRQKRWIGDYC